MPDNFEDRAQEDHGEEMTFLLRVDAKSKKHNGFVAGAEVIRDSDGALRWGRIAPIMRWFYGKSVEDIGRYLKGPARKAGWTFSWIRLEN